MTNYTVPRIVFLLFLISVSTGSNAAVNRIVLIGNSITQGKKSSDNLGFRDELYYRLKDMGYPFEFVGDTGYNPYKGHFKAGAFIGDFYSGRGGNGSFVCNYVMDNFKPTIAVIHLGSNDFWLDEGPAPYTENGGLTFTKKIAGKLANLVDALLRWNDGTSGRHLNTIFVCKIIPKSWRHAEGIKKFNAEVGRFVEDVNAGRVSKIPPGIVKLVDQYSTFDSKTMLDSDGIHPNKAGYRHMARIFTDAIKTLPLYLQQVAGGDQTALPNTVLSQPLTIRISNGYDKDSPNVPVRFEVVKGDAQILAPISVKTDSLGLASVEVQLGYAEVSKIRATANGLIDSTTVFTIKTRKLLQAEGQITYYNGLKPVPSVDLIWQEKAVPIGTSDDTGVFHLDSLPRQESVTFLPQKQPIPYQFGSTILSYDAALIARHVVGLDSLTDRQKDAADVDRDSTITMLDAAHVARYAVGLDRAGSAFPGNWVFHPRKLTYDSLTTDLQGLAFSGIVLGDVHGGWSGDQVTINKPNNIHLQMSQIQRQDTVVIKMQVYGVNLLSCDLELEFPENYLIYHRVKKTEASRRFNLLNTRISKGTLRIGLFGTESLSEYTDFLEIHFLRKQTINAFLPVMKKAIINNIYFEAEAIATNIDGERIIPESMTLGHNYPNPFNSETVIPFYLPKRTKIKIDVYNIVGEKVRQLVNGSYGPGSYQICWDGCNGSGELLPSGPYFVRLTGQGRYFVQKIELIR